MAIQQLTVSGYRSIQDLSLALGPINVITGPNACGKTNLYRAVLVISQAAHGQLARTLAAEGGMPSVLWAGERPNYTRSKKPVRMRVGVRTDEFSYELVLGVPPAVPPSRFDLDPEVKEEYVWFGAQRRKANTLLERKAASTWVTRDDGERIVYPASLTQNESVLAQLHEPHLYPELSALREEIRRWRFYHYFRTDAGSPIRLPQVGVRTPVLSHDGYDLAAALQTIIEIGDVDALRRAIDRAFPGARLGIQAERAEFAVQMHMPGIKRPFEAKELSDGTLRYLCLAAALLSPRPPQVLALNEPEMSLHPDLMAPLAQLIVEAAAVSQLWVTTHSPALARHIAEHSGAEPIELERVAGATRVAGAHPYGLDD